MAGEDPAQRSGGTLRRAGGRAALSGVLAMTLAVILAPGVASAHKVTSGKSVTLQTGTLTLRFTAAAFAALTKDTTGTFADTRTVTPITPGVAGSSGVFSFPLTSGKLNVGKLTGKAASKGGLNFEHTSTLPLLGSSTTQFALTSFALHFGGALAALSGTFVGSSTSPNQPLAALSTGHARHSLHRRAVSISGISLKLTSAGVAVLNGDDNVFKVGQVIGSASISATT
jgi:hypothetical protein